MAWEHWYHLSTHTCGTWLPGDGRGFCTRHHRLHVGGDYKRPPAAGRYDGLHRYSESVMTRPAVFLGPDQRARAVADVVRSPDKWRVPVDALSIDRVHLHVLVQVADDDPRHWLGLAEKESGGSMRRDGLAPAGGLWAAACGVTPIAGALHDARAGTYVADRAEQAAVVYRDPLPGLDLNDLLVD